MLGVTDSVDAGILCSAEVFAKLGSAGSFVYILPSSYSETPYKGQNGALLNLQ